MDKMDYICLLLDTSHQAHFHLDNLSGRANCSHECDHRKPGRRVNIVYAVVHPMNTQNSELRNLANLLHGKCRIAKDIQVRKLDLELSSLGDKVHSNCKHRIHKQPHAPGIRDHLDMLAVSLCRSRTDSISHNQFHVENEIDHQLDILLAEIELLG